jgi:hypothetical protein
MSWPALRTTQTPIQWVSGDISLGVKRPGREADHSPPSSAEVKECVELKLHSPNTSSWRGAYLSTETTLLTYLLLVAGHYLKSRLSLSLSKNILLTYGTQRFITVFTKARHWTLSWANRIQFAPSIRISLRTILMLSSHLRLGLPSGLFSSGLPTKNLQIYRFFMKGKLMVPFLVSLKGCLSQKVLSMNVHKYEGRLKSSWIHLIPSRNFVEVRWRSLFRSTSLDKRCTSYSASPPSRKRAADILAQAPGG